MHWNNDRLSVTIESDAAILTNALSEQQIIISLRSPKLDFGERKHAGGEAPLYLTQEDTSEGPRWIGEFSPITLDHLEANVKVWLQAYNEKPYVRKSFELTLTGPETELPFWEIEMDRVELAGLSPDFYPRGDQSAPILCHSFFLGVEFPISIARLVESTAVLASRPGIYIRTSEVFKSRDCVYAATEPGQAAKSFRQYVQEFRSQPTDIFFGYNNWWTTPVQLNSEMIVDLAKTVKRELWEKRGVAPDVFTMDLGWSDPHTIWEIDRKTFPNGFADITAVLDEMGTGLGFWCSPCSAYPDGLDNNWARDAGYETFKADHWVSGNLCVGGPRYSEDFIKHTSEIVGRYQVRHIKFDSYRYHCSSSEHGHLPGAWSAEPIAQRMVDLYVAAKAASPLIRLNAPQRDRPVVFEGEKYSEPLPEHIPPDNRHGYLRGGPWWLKYMHFMASVEGEDYPYGRVPAPNYRDSYTTARAYRVLMFSLDQIVPVDCKEVFGIINQADEPLFNDAVDVLLRGHQFISLYLNPEKTDDAEWDFIAKIIRYGRANKDILRNTTTLFPESWKQTDGSLVPGPSPMRDPYGFVHADEQRAVVYLRNPWMQEQCRTIRLDESCGFPNSGFVWNAESLYPYRRTYERELRYGDEITIHLQPYQNVLLELSAQQPESPEYVRPRKLSVLNVDCQVEKKRIVDSQREYGPDWTKAPRRLDKGPAQATIQCSIDAQHDLNRLMILVESGNQEPSIYPSVQVTANEEPISVELTSSRDGWSADMGVPPENWTWHVAELPSGESIIEATVTASSANSKVSVWLVGETDVADPGQSPLLHPKPVENESVKILAATQMYERLTEEAAGVHVVEKIDGVYLDSIEPISSKQGWREMARNQSLQGRRIVIGNQEFERGLGMHAPAEVVYDLDGQWSGFTASVGANAMETGTVTFAVKVDDKIVCETEVMKAGDEAEKVEVDLRGAQTLTLLVGDGGDGNHNDMADWGDAVLWR